MRRKKLKMFDVLLKYWTGGLSWKLAIKFIFHSSSKTGILYFHNILQFAIKFCVALAGNAKTRKLSIVFNMDTLLPFIAKLPLIIGGFFELG